MSMPAAFWLGSGIHSRRAYRNLQPLVRRATLMQQSMRTPAESHEGWYPRPTWQSTAGVAAFAVLGMVLSLFTFPLFRRFGFAAVVMVIGTPFLLALFVRAIPELFSGLQAV